jgi:hypothetical protein
MHSDLRSVAAVDEGLHVHLFCQVADIIEIGNNRCALEKQPFVDFGNLTADFRASLSEHLVLLYPNMQQDTWG